MAYLFSHAFNHFLMDLIAVSQKFSIWMLQIHNRQSKVKAGYAHGELFNELFD